MKNKILLLALLFAGCAEIKNKNVLIVESYEAYQDGSYRYLMSTTGNGTRHLYIYSGAKYEVGDTLQITKIKHETDATTSTKPRS